MRLADNPLQQYLFLFKKANNLRKDQDWLEMEDYIIESLYAGTNKYDIEFLFDDFLDHQIVHGGNVFGFIVGSSGSGKSLTGLTIVNNYLIPKLQICDHLSGIFNITWTFSETQRFVPDTAPKGMIILQDEVPRLIGGESETVLKSWTNWMEQARAQRPFILFCSPTLWNLPNLHFAIKVIPAKYKDKNKEHLIRAACLIAIPEQTMSAIKFRVCGSFFVDILSDNDILKKIYFEAKLINLKKNARYGGARSAGWDSDKIERALQEIRDALEENYPGEKILAADSKRIMKIIRKNEIAAGSTQIEKELCSYILEEVNDQQEAIKEQQEQKQLELIEKLVPEVDAELPNPCKIGSINQSFLEKGIQEQFLKTAKEKFQLFRDRKDFTLEKKNGITVQTSSLPEDFWKLLLDLMLEYVEKKPKLRQAFGAAIWKTRLEFFYLYQVVKWQGKDIVSLPEYENKNYHTNTPRLYAKHVRKVLAANNAMMAFVGETFFQQKLSDVPTVFLLASGKSRGELFDSSISNQHVDFWLLEHSGVPLGIVEVKVHFSRDEFVASPGNAYAKKLGLPLFVFLIDARERQAMIRFGRLAPGDFFRENLRVDTVGAISSMEEIAAIIEKELGLPAATQEMQEEVKT